MRKIKPLSWLMVFFVSTAFAVDGTSSRTTSPIKATSSNTVVASRVVDRGITSRSEGATRGDGSTGTRVKSRETASVNKQTERSNANVVLRDTSNSRGVSKDAKERSSSGVASRTTGTSSRSTTSNVSVRPTGVARTATTAHRTAVNAVSSVSETGRKTVTRISENQTNKASVNRAVTKTISKESLAEAKEVLEQTAELNKSCQIQYNECMDQFCAIVDSNQKRCSCSANLSKYKKVEDAVTKANAQLNEVAQNIRYIGLSADEIRAIMTATEAEEALAGTKDNTENRNMLEQIERMIKDPQTSSASYSGDSFGLDMSLDFSSDASDIFSLDFLNVGTTTTSFSNLRGTELYNAARSRCNTVLNQCKKAGATVSQVTGNYDLSIDKDCIAYEAGLKKMNETLISNVRSAERMLQKARLAVLENKNQYDAKGCIAALESCMTDDMVCGDDYAMCVDPTKKYIDENGEVVLGQNIASITAFMKNYNNAKIDKNFLELAYGMNISESDCAGNNGNDGKCTVKYLLQKIGTKQKVTDEGLCRAVLDKCQAYTYKDKEYQPYNDVVVNYIQRAMVNIKAAQHKIISDYASSCMVDVASCYNQQVTQVNSWTTSASTNSIYNIMNGACRSVALTCGLAIFVGDPDIDGKTLYINDTQYAVNGCQAASGKSGAAQNSAIIQCVSEMFYQSLLCPDNSEYQTTAGTAGEGDYVNTRCKCSTGYSPNNGYCVKDADTSGGGSSSGGSSSGGSPNHSPQLPGDSGSGDEESEEDAELSEAAAAAAISNSVYTVDAVSAVLQTTDIAVPDNNDTNQ